MSGPRARAEPVVARRLARDIASLAAGRTARLMEVCGGHTHAIYRHGLDQMLSPAVSFVHGPGCPVCVIPPGRIDDAVAAARTPGVVLTCFGDMMRVPGGDGSLLEARARGADVRVVYSPLDVLDIAAAEPDRRVVFLAVGFETTAPATAVTVLRARERGLRNLAVLSNHVTIVPPLAALLDAPDLRVDGFVGPGHVSTVIGTRPYRFIAERHRRPVVVAGFDPVDILEAVAMLVRQLREGRCEVENQYVRAVREEGNPRALAVMDEVFQPRDAEWRGLGMLPGSGLRLRDAFAAWDADAVLRLPGRRRDDPGACRCGEVLRGALEPWRCGVFGTACTPERPLGTCMVSSEGACAAYFTYARGRAPVEAVP